MSPLLKLKYIEVFEGLEEANVSKNLVQSIRDLLNKTYEEGYAEGEEDLKQRIESEKKNKKKKPSINK